MVFTVVLNWICAARDKAQTGNVAPTFYSLAGEVIAIPEKFVADDSRNDKSRQLRWLFSRALSRKAAPAHWRNERQRLNATEWFQR